MFCIVFPVLKNLGLVACYLAVFKFTFQFLCFTEIAGEVLPDVHLQLLFEMIQSVMFQQGIRSRLKVFLFAQFAVRVSREIIEQGIFLWPLGGADNPLRSCLSPPWIGLHPIHLLVRGRGLLWGRRLCLGA